jgi:serine/threonine protein phosphatase 1
MKWPRLFGQNHPPLRGDERIYAIGDVHGRLDLLHRLIGMIEDDLAHGHPATRLIFLGDVIDRGPDSAELVALLMKLDGNPRVTVLKGNHEAALADAWRGDHDALEGWLANGGDATLRSYGADRASLETADTRTLFRLLQRTIPERVIRWCERLPVSERVDGYMFVHAGVRPGVALEAQSEDDMLWIREEFTRSDVDHGAVIVHGHSAQSDGIHFAANRIGVDTAAYRSDRLSAVVIDANGCRALMT